MSMEVDEGISGYKVVIPTTMLHIKFTSVKMEIG